MSDPAAVRHFSAWPSCCGRRREDRSFRALRAAILMGAGTALLTLSAKVNLPLPYVPMTLQTLVVLMIGAAMAGGSQCHRDRLSGRGCDRLAGIFAGPVGGFRAADRSDGGISLWLRAGGDWSRAG